jgi:hypothetical protein
MKFLNESMIPNRVYWYRTCSGMKLALETEVRVLVMEMRDRRWWVVIVLDSSQ